MRIHATLGLLVLGGLSGVAAADTVNVDARSAIFDAGQGAPTLGGLLPPMLAIPAGTDYVTVSDVVGLVRAHTLLQWGGADGNSTTFNDTDINSYLSISGIVHPRTLPLLAVFLGDGLPEGAPPARLDFWGIGSDFAELSPLERQTFFVGDGLAADGDGFLTQKFWVPEGATRIFFGLADGSYFTGDPGAYHDNEGAFSASVQFHVLPAPGSLALLALGGATMIRRRR